MDNKKKGLLSGSLVAGALLAAVTLPVSATPAFHFNELGSGATVRTNLLEEKASTSRALELKCGEKKDSAKVKGKEGKCGEGKCGEGKCGGKKKKGNKKDSTKAEKP
ncbi:hypothetical protein KTO58_15820 [Chitinophaga pendula]|uniref:HvfA family oxazolone/thioamide-modified RiPP metallophore n=1 Tax=Chitinophaga TaxID=79328 RepID=UPI000BAF6813|nr:MULTISPECIES: hypothetical protein [Chitinophaga]ASZ11817.1 hypothetical protein CK934_13035 [Chitinophaga sp. MD30]UCJ05162.1 hypothetical protein KTO58_15820 [Chitinophaga pendula]